VASEVGELRFLRRVHTVENQPGLADRDQRGCGELKWPPFASVTSRIVGMDPDGRIEPLLAARATAATDDRRPNRDQDAFHAGFVCSGDHGRSIEPEAIGLEMGVAIDEPHRAGRV